MKIVFALFFLLNLGWSIFVSAFPPPDECTKPCVILRDSYDREVNDNNQLGLSDSLFGSFFNLNKDKEYYLSIMRDGKEISKLCLRSDATGVITTCALWWSLGFNYDTSDGQKRIDLDFANHTYNLSMKDDKNNPVLETKIPVSNSTGRAYIYTCDKDKNPKNTFIRNKDDVYLKGGNFKAIDDNRGTQETQDNKLYIYVVKDRWSWGIGDRADDKDFLKQKYVETLSGEVLESPHMIWPNDDIEVGSYDIIVSYKNMGILFASDLIWSNYGVGFKVVDPQVEDKAKKDITQELACQAPPHILQCGLLDQPHKAIYKDYFSPIEEIWVAVEIPDPTPEQIKAKQARIYVIEHQEGKPLKDGDKLQDVSGGYEEVLLQPDCAHGVFTRVWCAPEVREQGYDVVIDFKNSNHRFGTFDKGLDILDNGIKIEGGEKVKGKHMVDGTEVEHGGFYVPEKWVCLESLTLNHTRNSICSDAINIKFENPANRCPEWVRGKKSFPAAYVKNSRITVNPKFIASEDVREAVFEAHTSSGNFSDVIEGYANLYTGKEKSNNVYYQLPYNVSSYNETDKIYLLQLQNNTPDRIQTFYQMWDWYLKGIKPPFEEAIHIGSTLNKIYIVLALPQYPWTLKGDTDPWSMILDMCCQVAYGESEPESAAGKITQFFYDEVGAKYSKSASRYSGDSPSSAFPLEEFVNQIPTVGEVNCYDMGKALVTFGNVLGCNLTLRYCDSFGELNCIMPVGRLWNCDNEDTNDDFFDNHVFASIGDNVFDASLKADSLGDPGASPHREAWMINIPWLQYKEFVLKKINIKKCLETNKPKDEVLKCLKEKIAMYNRLYPHATIFKIKK